MYLRVVNGTRSKDFTLTNQYNQKPYMVVNGNQKLPLTTKPPKDYSTSSESGSYYTTSVNSGGLYSTTALTRASTYETVYGTRASTYNTIYGTINRCIYSSWSAYDAYVGTNRTANGITRWNSGTQWIGDNVSTNYNFYGAPLSWTQAGGVTWTIESQTAHVYPGYIIDPSGVYIKETTGTTYLTRASTSGTSYLTRTSTSGYQGISSTSTSGSYITAPGGNMFIKVVNGTKTYRPLISVSTSQSATYKTSLYNSLGLSSTTALTRASTYQTIYDTRASTYNTIYQTANVYQGYSSGVVRNDYGGVNNTYNHVTNSGYRNDYEGMYYITYYGNPAYVTWPKYTLSGNALTWGINTYRGLPSLTAVYAQKTTNTVYQTRASTYNTRYNTRQSISAYSGVSSSSASASSWV